MKRIVVLLVLPCAIAAAASDVVIADFEGADYGPWTVSGKAFGKGPAQGTLPNQMAVSGFLGKGFVNTYLDGDGAKGKLVSPEVEIVKKYVNFLIGGGAHPTATCVNLVIGKEVVRTATGRNDERLDWFSWNVGKFLGAKARFEIVDNSTGGWGHVNVDQIMLSDEPKAEEMDVSTLYNETYRPQFHFSPKQNWTNDPNGLVFYKGEYHLFFQHNPLGINWGNMHWGHAVSPDLVHWTELPIAIAPDKFGTVFSGSAVVDRDNTSGLKTGDEDVLCAFHTGAGDPFVQCMSYSNDRGRTWVRYEKDPIIGNHAEGNRDPKVIWHAPTAKWVMTLYLKDNDFAFFGSKDLKEWALLSTITVKGSTECPDLFELPVDQNPADTRWVFLGGDGNYLIGRFDGREFTPETEKFEADYGKNFYATQSYSDIPDGRRIQLAWMNGGAYPGMPFNQQMSFPCELTLRTFPDGLRVCRNPVKEVAALRGTARNIANETLAPDKNPLDGIAGELFEIIAEIELGTATACGFVLRGEPVRFDAARKELTCLGAAAPLEPVGGTVMFHILLDRTTIEVYANGGRVSMSSCFLPSLKDKKLAMFAEGGTATVKQCQAYELKSAWRD